MEIALEGTDAGRRFESYCAHHLPDWLPFRNSRRGSTGPFLSSQPGGFVTFW